MDWVSYTRQGLDVASSAASLAFSAAKSGTRLGFSVARGVAGAAATVTGALVGGSPVLGGAITSALSLAEQLTLAPLYLGEYITATSLLAAHSSIIILSAIFPGSSEASFSLASFITLVRRECNIPPDSSCVPEKQYGFFHVARAVVAWVALQGVTQECQEKRWFKSLREINVDQPRKQVDSTFSRQRRGSRIRVTSDVIFPGNKAQIIAAEFGDFPKTYPGTPNLLFPHHSRLPDHNLKATLRRLSKLVLAGYGGASLLFFGVPPHRITSTQIHSESTPEHANQLAHAVNASEAEAAGDPEHVENDAQSSTAYSWWDVLLGRHDHEIFQRAAAALSHNESLPSSIVAGMEHLMPRFWVLSDHARRQVVLVFRGTMSLNEIAVDLTCDPDEFEHATTPLGLVNEEDEHTPIPGAFTTPPPPAIPFPSASERGQTYMVHGGMLRMARAMGDPGKPVQVAVRDALMRNRGYELILCGHSLGAGVAGLLGLMWADPETCLTVSTSGLPKGRKVSVYCFAPPCLVDPTLSHLSNKLITSFVYSHDVVSRLSLGSVRDLRNAAMWLCDAVEEEGYVGVLKRIERWKAGGRVGGEGEDDLRWFIAMRKTLEANMQMADLYPPGRVLWALRDGDLHPGHRLHEHSIDKLRLFDVLDVEKVFSQIVFAKDMLSAHMPHQYDRVLHDLI